jgi:phosphotransferase system HPr (HPr) family protein
MLKSTFLLNNHSGFHARPAALFVTEASKHASEVTLINNKSREANAKSILGIIGLGIEAQTEFTLQVTGVDEEIAFHALKSVIELKLVE